MLHIVLVWDEEFLLVCMHVITRLEVKPDVNLQENTFGETIVRCICLFGN